MPAEIVTCHFCADWFSSFVVPSSRGGNSYRVHFQQGFGAVCECKAYEYSKDKTCKHVRYVMEHACLWNEQWYSGGDRTLRPEPDSLVGYPIISGATCPQCGGPVCPVRIAV